MAEFRRGSLVMLLLFVSLGTLLSLCCGEIVYCGRGQRIVLDKNDPGKDQCKPCFEGAYQDSRRHRNIYCKRCKDPYSSFFVSIGKCTRFRDTQFRCIKSEHYFDTTTNDCKSCNNCSRQFVAFNCSRYEDARCCPRQDMSIRNGRCTVRCGTGEYFENDRCLRCPPNTTNYNRAHFKPECFEKCFSGRNINIQERGTCLKGESSLGRSCQNRSRVMCIQSAVEVDINGRDESSKMEKSVEYKTVDKTKESQGDNPNSSPAIILAAAVAVLSILLCQR